ncbi:hypothetical protein [Lignipirellula cremea]|uniref:hypothetical protein n=1 Tax=Lignipirellula cremea TaxID=2528010 RepID=UPI0011A4ED2B|nr:hypothetical protein [Lignipirellula cremea]
MASLLREYRIPGREKIIAICGKREENKDGIWERRLKKQQAQKVDFRSDREKNNCQILIRRFKEGQTPDSRLSLRERSRSFAEQKTTDRRPPSVKSFPFPVKGD